MVKRFSILTCDIDGCEEKMFGQIKTGSFVVARLCMKHFPRFINIKKLDESSVLVKSRTGWKPLEDAPE
jgi:hypothetical protein